MKNNVVDVVRWWMFPDLRGDGIKLDSSKTPSGLGSTVVSDINAALDIAAQLDIHIKLTLFSFNDFYADYTDSGITIVGLQPIATDATKRAALIKNVVIPVAQAVEASPDPTLTGSSGQTTTTLTFAQMETFVKDVVTALHGASSAPVYRSSSQPRETGTLARISRDVSWTNYVHERFYNKKSAASHRRREWRARRDAILAFLPARKRQSQTA